MKLTVILLLGAFLQVGATGYSQKITLSLEKVSLEQVLSAIRAQSDYLFFYDLDVLKRARPVSLHVKEADIREVLEHCFRRQPLQYDITSRIIIVKSKQVARGEEILTDPPPPFTVTGTITDETGKPLSGASIKLKGTDRGVASRADGGFAIEVPAAGGTLVISYIGYEVREIVVDEQSTLNIRLNLSDAKIEEVVVVGYGTRNKGDLTGSVSSISTEEFEEQPVTRLDQILQGRAAGVQVTSASGSPGGDVRIRIRGANSLTGDNSPLYVVDGFVGADFNNINAEDIASVVVLKDAASTAIYGSRGANGVVIITTKTGSRGGSRVDFMSRVSSSTVIDRFDLMNAADFAETVNARALALTPPGSTYTPRFTDTQIQQFRNTGGTDWQDQVFRTAMGQEYQLGLSGGSGKTLYLVNGNYLQQEGIIDNSDYQRYSIRTNLSSQLSDRFSMRLFFTGIRRENHNTSGTGARGGSLGQALAWAPTTPVYESDGSFVIKDPTSSIFQNPVALNKETDDRSLRTNLNLIGGLRYEFLPELSLDVQFGVNYTNDQFKGFRGPDITGNNPTADRSSGENILLQNTNNLTYKKTFNGKHALEVTGVFETQKFTGSGFGVGVTGLTYPSQRYDNIALSSSSKVNSGYSQWSLLSLLGRVHYEFDNKYLATASLRRDGSSKFQGKNKYSLFPSAGIGWRLSEEEFMKEQNVFRDLKLRASWGLTGNQGINPYGTLSTYVTNLDDAGVVFDGSSGSIVSGILMGNPGNPLLKWETTEQINAGLDIGLLQGALVLTADYFVKKTRDLLLNQPLPAYLGGYAILSNIGDMENKGWEFSVGVDAFARRAFNWSSSLNISFVKNTLISLGGEQTDIRFNQFILKPGEPIGSFFGYKYLGTYKPDKADEAAAYNLKPGDAQYADTDGNGVIDTKDYQIIGHSLPTSSMGWNNTFRYRSLSLNIFLQGLFGMDKLNYSYANGMVGGTDAKEVIFSDIQNRYIPGVNENSDIPAFSTAPSNSYVQSSRFIEKADFVRLKNVTLSYEISRSALKELAAVKVFVSALNLLTFTNYRGIDPESNSNKPEGLNFSGFVADTEQGLDHGAYPNSKTLTLGLNISF